MGADPENMHSYAQSMDGSTQVFLLPIT